MSFTRSPVKWSPCQNQGYSSLERSGSLPQSLVHFNNKESRKRTRIESSHFQAGVAMPTRQINGVEKRCWGLTVPITPEPSDGLLDPSHRLGRNVADGIDHVGGGEGDEPATDGGVRLVQSCP